MSSRLIVALDGMSWSMAADLTWRLKDHIWGIKMNDLIIDQGLISIREFSRYTNVMADLKLYDIPNTICNTVKKLREAGAEIITVHATAEYNTDNDLTWYRNHLAGVTRLTSMSKDWEERIYNTKYGEDLVSKLAYSVVQRGWKYLVCSADDIKRLNVQSWIGPATKLICPSIALSSSNIKKDDQRKRFTPKEAAENGADFIVVGRAITQSEGDSLDIVKQINKDFAEGLATWKNDEH